MVSQADILRQQQTSARASQTAGLQAQQRALRRLKPKPKQVYIPPTQAEILAAQQKAQEVAQKKAREIELTELKQKLVDLATERLEKYESAKDYQGNVDIGYLRALNDKFSRRKEILRSQIKAVEKGGSASEAARIAEINLRRGETFAFKQSPEGQKLAKERAAAKVAAETSILPQKTAAQLFGTTPKAYPWEKSYIPSTPKTQPTAQQLFAPKPFPWDSGSTQRLKPTISVENIGADFQSVQDTTDFSKDLSITGSSIVNGSDILVPPRSSPSPDRNIFSKVWSGVTGYFDISGAGQDHKEGKEKTYEYIDPSSGWIVTAKDLQGQQTRQDISMEEKEWTSAFTIPESVRQERIKKEEKKYGTAEDRTVKYEEIVKDFVSEDSLTKAQAKAYKDKLKKIGADLREVDGKYKIVEPKFEMIGGAWGQEQPITKGSGYGVAGAISYPITYSTDFIGKEFQELSETGTKTGLDWVGYDPGDVVMKKHTAKKIETKIDPLTGLGKLYTSDIIVEDIKYEDIVTDVGKVGYVAGSAVPYVLAGYAGGAVAGGLGFGSTGVTFGEIVGADIVWGAAVAPEYLGDVSQAGVIGGTGKFIKENPIDVALLGAGWTYGAFKGATKAKIKVKDFGADDIFIPGIKKEGTYFIEDVSKVIEKGDSVKTFQKVIGTGEDVVQLTGRKTTVSTPWRDFWNIGDLSREDAIKKLVSEGMTTAEAKKLIALQKPTAKAVDVTGEIITTYGKEGVDVKFEGDIFTTPREFIFDDKIYKAGAKSKKYFTSNLEKSNADFLKQLAKESDVTYGKGFGLVEDAYSQRLSSYVSGSKAKGVIDLPISKIDDVLITKKYKAYKQTAITRDVFGSYTPPKTSKVYLKTKYPKRLDISKSNIFIEVPVGKKPLKIKYLDDLSDTLAGTKVKPPKTSKTPYSVTHADDFAKLKPAKVKKVKIVNPLDDIGDALSGTGVKQKPLKQITEQIEELKVGVTGGVPKIKVTKTFNALDDLSNVLSGSKIKPYVFTTPFGKIDTKQKTKVIPLFSTPTKVDYDVSLFTDTLPVSRIKTSPIQIPQTIQSPVSNVLLGGYVPISPRPTTKVPKTKPPVIPKIPFPNFGRGILTGGGKQQGYNVFVKQRGKKIKITKNPLSKPMARDLLTFTLDNSLSATGSFRKTKKKIGKAEYKIPPNYRIKTFNKFRKYKVVRGKKKPLKNKVIEKATFRLDTRNEVRNIQASKLLAGRKIKPLRKARKINLSGGYNPLGARRKAPKKRKVVKKKKAIKKKKPIKRRKNNKIKIGFV